MKPVLITGNTVGAVVAYCQAEKVKGKEACGFVLAERGSRVATMMLTVENTAPAPARRYETLDAEIIAAYRHFDSEGLEPIAFFHSHLDSPALMSDLDLAQAIDTTLAYLIVSMTDERDPKARAYRVTRPFIGMVEHEQVPIEIRRADSGIEPTPWPWALAPGNEVTLTYHRSRQKEPGVVTATVTACTEDTVSLNGKRLHGVKPPTTLALERIICVLVEREGEEARIVARQAAVHARNLTNAIRGSDWELVPALVEAIALAYPPGLVIEVKE